MAIKIGDKSCQSNFDTRASDFGSFLLSYLITTVSKYALEFEETTLSSQFVYFHFIRLDENEKNFIGLSPKCYCLRMRYRLNLNM